MKKAVKVLTTAALLSSLAAPLAAPAYAAGSITALSVPTVSDQTDNSTTPIVETTKLGAIKLNIPAGSISSGDVVTISLPADVRVGSEFGAAAGVYDFGAAPATTQANLTTSAGAPTKNGVVVPATINGNGDLNGLAGKLNVQMLDSDEIKLTATANMDPDKDGVVFIYLDDMWVDDASNGPLEATLSAPSNSGFPTGKVTIGNVNSNGTVKATVSGVDNSNDKFDFNLRLTEDLAGSLEKDRETLKLKLPSGYKWDLSNGTYTTGSTTVNGKTIKTIYGDNITFNVTVDDEELVIDTASVNAGSGFSTGQASQWEIPLGFSVDDESKVKEGDVVARITGKTDVDLSEVVVGKYGEYGSGVKAIETPSLIAGKDDQEIGDIHITENIEGSLIKDRTILLTLPEGARWQDQYEGDADGDNSTTDSPTSFDGSIKTDEGLKVRFVGYTGTDKRTAKFVVDQSSSDNATLKIEDAKVAIQPGFSGDLEVTVDGTAGIEGKVVVAKVDGVVKATAENVPNVIIGLSDQKAADVTLEETVAGAFGDDDDVQGNSADKVVLELPDGVKFTKTPTVTVDGDVKISNVKRTSDDKAIEFTIDSESTKASKIKVSDISVKVDRTVPEGDIKLKVKGSSLTETSLYSDWTNTDVATSVTIAKVATPAPTDTTASNIVFKLNSKTFTVDGKEMEMDAAPLVGWDRAYLPVRFAANALNVADDNIIWDDKTSTFTIFKGDRVITGKVGDKFLTVNGVKVPMDVPVWRNKAQTNNRVMVPIRYLANALNANIEWNKETSEITIQAKK